ncbi:hypothetical protein QTP70_012591 [Hemibagrus guttatus]|uniref:Reverse transcriptase RNase H-like domain-containing protein n=1 Tax=Hemibagrus guttatus TaxID=175788 RepID=A0AAE0QBN3_9TELE|nr:hypothetical protein QTP70_012591 [Hemibagrus guttatus]
MDLKKVTVVMDWPELTTVKRGQLLLYSNKASPSRELLSIKAVLEEWRHWLEGARHLFLVLTDHRNLEYLHNAKRLNPCQALWVLFFTRFQFSVIYHLGTKNSNADALSWRHDLASTPAQPESILSPSIVLAPIRWNLEEEMQQALVNKPLPPTCLAIKLYVPSALRPRVLQWVHEAPSSGHHVHNIIQSFRESGISVRKGQGRKTILDARDLRALRRHCITYRNATVMEITTWAQEYFQKTLSVNTIHRAIRRCRLILYRSKKKPYLNMIQKRRRFLWAKAHLKWTVAKWKTVLWSDESKFEVLFGKLGRHVIRTKEDKDSPSCYQRSVQKPASLMVWGCMSACGMGSLHIWKGTINAERTGGEEE